MQCLNWWWAARVGGRRSTRGACATSLFSQENGQLPRRRPGPGRRVQSEFNNMFASNLGSLRLQARSRCRSASGAAAARPLSRGSISAAASSSASRSTVRPRELRQEPGLQHDLGLDHRRRRRRPAAHRRRDPRRLHLAEGRRAPSGAVAAKQAEAASWDGKTPFSCGNNDVIALTGNERHAGRHRGRQLPAHAHERDHQRPVAINAGGNAKVNVVGGAVTGTVNSRRSCPRTAP